MAQQPLRFAAPDARIDATLWAQLAHVKLHELRLSEGPVAATGWLLAGAVRPTLALSAASIAGAPASARAAACPVGAAQLHGAVHCLNTAEEVQALAREGSAARALVARRDAAAAWAGIHEDDGSDLRAWLSFRLFVHLDLSSAGVVTWTLLVPAVVVAASGAVTRDVWAPSVVRHELLGWRQPSRAAGLSGRQLESIAQQASQTGYAAEPLLVAVRQQRSRGAPAATPAAAAAASASSTSSLLLLPLARAMALLGLRSGGGACVAAAAAGGAQQAADGEDARADYAVMALEEYERSRAWRPSRGGSEPPRSSSSSGSGGQPLADAVFLFRDGLAGGDDGPPRAPAQQREEDAAPLSPVIEAASAADAAPPLSTLPPRQQPRRDGSSLRLGWTARSLITALGARHGLARLPVLLLRPVRVAGPLAGGGTGGGDDGGSGGARGQLPSARALAPEGGTLVERPVAFVELLLVGAAAGTAHPAAAAQSAVVVPAQLLYPLHRPVWHGLTAAGPPLPFTAARPPQWQVGCSGVAALTSPGPWWDARGDDSAARPWWRAHAALREREACAPPPALTGKQHEREAASLAASLRLGGDAALTCVGWLAGGPRRAVLRDPHSDEGGGAAAAAEAAGTGSGGGPAHRDPALNLSLMRWRMLPELDVPALAGLRVLLLGAGTLGCHVARGLLAWGVTRLTLVDDGRVSFSNPLRQPLYEAADADAHAHRGAFKVHAAVAALRRIHPGVLATGVVLTIPSPGHPALGDAEGGGSGSGAAQSVRAAVDTLEALYAGHDLVFLLTDTRESRWLPTVLSATRGVPAITIALGFDSLVIVRHGLPPPAAARAPRARPSCYFCGDGGRGPSDSTAHRALDQACTVTRPGVASLAAALAVELAVGALHHPLRFHAPSVEEEGGAQAGVSPDAAGGPRSSYSSSAVGPAAAAAAAAALPPLGVLPQQLRFFMRWLTPLMGHTPAAARCIACSAGVTRAYAARGADLVLDAVNAASGSGRLLEALAASGAGTHPLPGQLSGMQWGQPLLGQLDVAGAGAALAAAGSRAAEPTAAAAPTVSVAEPAGSSDAESHAGADAAGGSLGVAAVVLEPLAAPTGSTAQSLWELL